MHFFRRDIFFDLERRLDVVFQQIFDSLRRWQAGHAVRHRLGEAADAFDHQGPAHVAHGDFFHGDVRGFIRPIANEHQRSRHRPQPALYVVGPFGDHFIGGDETLKGIREQIADKGESAQTFLFSQQRLIGVYHCGAEGAGFQR